VEHATLHSYLARSLDALGAPTSSASHPIESLTQLALLTARWSKRMNLTGPRSAREISDLLILPPFAWARRLSQNPQTIIDLGSGAGFPGFPLAFCFPGARIVLVEARERRHHFQRAVCRELALTNVEPLLGRIESLPAHPGDLVVAQALAPPQRVLPLMRRWATPGGTLAIPLGAHAPVPESPDLETVRLITYPTPGGGRVGKLWVARQPV
jgi:16S rRNA (guanine527-N7)-methyltransferase